MTPHADPGLIAGIDGGGTRTACVVYSPLDGRLGEGRGGPLNTNYVPQSVAETSVGEALAGAAAMAGTDPRHLACVGAAAPWSERAVEAVVARVSPVARVLIPGEDVAALLGGTLQPHGLVLIAGTGSRCAYIPAGAAVDAGSGGGGDAAAVVAGAWGSLFGDEGSGYDIGCRALQAVTRAWDGRGPGTALSERLAAAWGLQNQKDIVHRVYGSGTGRWRGRVASVAPLVGEAAAAGDPVACAILDQAADELALLVKAVVARAGLSRPATVLVSGGVFALGALIIDRLRTRLAVGSLAEIRMPVFPPVCGALLAAARAAGLDADEGSAIVRALAAVYDLRR
ncbi:MAG: BadF/BadG/BcrA/BcrD ATPase family protein [Bacillota bacterium]|nr:BadF/BadG/BcrA/BcrD ATPase family protein [Bacillota bacterium]